jgi:hypothetical protein
VGTAARGFIAACLSAVLASACTSGDDPADGDRAAPTSSAASTTTGQPTSTGPSQTSPPSESTEPSSSPTRTSDPPAGPVRFDKGAAMRTIQFLAGEIGPREPTTAAYRRASRWARGRLESSGYDVRRQELRVPAGNSWGIGVPSGLTWNLVATEPGFDATKPHLIVGAHLDTVPQSPGAEDNASGVAVLLELARMAEAAETRLPVMFVVFTAEEPRGDGDELHHFGSTAMVARMSPAERRAMQGMVALGRVGVGTVVPVCTGGLEPPRVRNAVIRAAERIDIPTLSCLNTSNDHWSFEKAGLPAARVGGTSYAGYHSPGDVPSVINPSQLSRTGRVMWEWLSS